MRVIGLRGKRSYLKIITDNGVYQGKGELLFNGFCVYSNTITDESEVVIESRMLDQLIMAVKIYTEKNCKDFTVYFK